MPVGLAKRFGAFAIAAGVLGMTAVAATAADAPKEMKLYVFTSYPLDIAKAALDSSAPAGEKFMVPVAFFLIKHPKGNVLFETGNNDKLLTDKTYWGPLAAMLDKGVDPDLAIDTQLGKVGVKASDIKYVILGHMHLDHAGNVSRFPNSTIVVQRDEVQNAFWPHPGTACCYITADFENLRAPIGGIMANRQPMIELNGDLDLFGDQSIYIHRQVSHTPGTQIAVVRLPKTGTVVLTSDLCYLANNLEKDILPSVGLTYDQSGMLDGYHYVKRLQADEHADVIFAHDPDTFKAHKHSPEYYE
jgi:N-acyl homoserine lactone hydrolase